MQRTSIYLDDRDREALRVIKATHGIATDAGAVRLAIRQVAREAERLAKRRGRAADAEPRARTAPLVAGYRRADRGGRLFGRG